MRLLIPRATAAARRLPSSSELLTALTPFGSSARQLERVHDVLDPGVVLQPGEGGVFAVTGGLEPTGGDVVAVPGVLGPPAGHLGHERDVGVDPDTAEVQPAADPHGPAVVAGP